MFREFDFVQLQGQDTGPVSYTHLLKSIPRYVNHVRLNPKEVDYLIEQRIKFTD